MKVSELMTPNVVTVTPDQSMHDVMALFRSRKIRQVPVVEDSRLIGIVTDRDVKRATPSLLSSGGQDEYDRVIDETRVAQIMTRDPITVTSGASIKTALQILIDRKIGGLPVVDGGKLVGILTEMDFLRAFYATLEG